MDAEDPAGGVPGSIVGRGTGGYVGAEASFTGFFFLRFGRFALGSVLTVA